MKNLWVCGRVKGKELGGSFGSLQTFAQKLGVKDLGGAEKGGVGI